MWVQFFWENIHFGLNMFAALVFFAAFWLYFDAWTAKKTLKEGLRVFGFLLLALSFIVHATTIETSLLPTSLSGKNFENLLFVTVRSLGYAFIIISLLLDPIQPKPRTRRLAKISADQIIPFAVLPAIKGGLFLQPVMAAAIGFLYLRRGTVGLENHLKPVALSFFVLSISELFSLSSIFRQTQNVDLYNLVASFGSLWLIEHLILFFAVLILGRWVFGYLLKRLTSQLFMIFTCSVLAIFLLTTVTFTYLLLKNLETETLRQLETDVRVLDFAIESKKSESLSDAAVMAQSAQVIKATEEKDHKILFENLQNFLLTKKQSFLAVVDAGGVILARGEDKEKRGDSFSDDPLIKRALSGEAISSVVAKDGVLSSQISVRGVTPIKSGDKIIGAVMAGSIVDSAFIDGIKKATGLEASIYGGNKLSATTLIASDGRSRALGIKEEDSRIKAKVLGRGESFSGSVGILNVPYLGAYLPLKDIDNAPLGMLFVGKRQIVVLQTAGSSIELTFIVAAILMVLSIIPAFMISKYLANQLR